MDERLAKAKMLWNPVIYQAVDGAARAKLGEVEEYRNRTNYLGQLAKWQSFGFDVICRYERSKRERSIFRWYYRWRDGRKAIRK